jgi:DHA2 family multidrug resistance protein-like MFS transporter
MNIYYLVLVASLLPFAAIGEIFGYRRIFLIGLGLLLTGALMSGLSWSLQSLIVSRCVLALGSAAISAVTPALIRTIFPASQLGRGLGIYALVVALSFTIGPTVASTILSIGDWPAIYFVHLPIGIVAYLLSSKYLPASLRSSRRFDGVSAVLCAALFSFLLFGLAGVAHRLDWAVIIAVWAAALICGYVLRQREAQQPAPILAVDLFRNPMFSLSSVTSICAFTVQGLAFIALPFMLHDILKFSQAQTGFLITSWPAALAIMSLVTAPLADRYAPGMLASVGLLLLSIGMASIALLPFHPSSMDIGWRLALCGIGFGFFQTPNMRAIMASAPRERSGGASGIVATSRLLGQAIGAAIVALCLSLSPLEGPMTAAWIGSAVAGAGCLISLLRLLPFVRAHS